MFGRWFYLWCILVFLILVVPILHYGHVESGALHPIDSSRWIHFLIYAAAVALPVGVWPRGPQMFLSMVPIFVAIAIDCSASDPILAAIRPQMIPAEMFGVGAGILFGLNLRVMRKARDPLRAENEKPSSRLVL